MTATEAIRILLAHLGQSDELDEAIDFAVYALEQQEKGDAV